MSDATLDGIATWMRRFGVRRYKHGDTEIEMWAEDPSVAKETPLPVSPDEIRRKRYEREFGHPVTDALLKNLP